MLRLQKDAQLNTRKASLVLNSQNPYRRIRYAICFGMVAMQLSCIEPFRIDLERESDSYVVEAVLLDDARYQYVRVFRLKQEGTLKARQETIADATVQIENTSGDYFQLFPDETGIYLLPEYLPVQAGEQFRLQIDVNDDVRLLSKWETVPEKVEMTDGYWERTSSVFYNHNGIPITLNGFNFIVNTTEMPTDNVSLRWEYETTHINEAPYSPDLCNCRNCYIRTTPSNFVNAVRVINSIQKPLLNHHVQFIRLDRKFSFRMTMLVRQVTHTERAGVFYDFVQRQQQIQGTIFDPPPAVARGNIRLEGRDETLVYGLFEVGRLDEMAITVYRGDFDAEVISYATECEQKRFDGIFEPVCYNCYAEPGAGPRPYYY